MFMIDQTNMTLVKNLIKNPGVLKANALILYRGQLPVNTLFEKKYDQCCKARQWLFRLTMPSAAGLVELQLKHPGLNARQDRLGGTHITGVVCINQVYYRLKLQCPEYPQLTGAKLSVLQLQSFKDYNIDELGLAEDAEVLSLLEQLPTLVDTNHSQSSSKVASTRNIYADVVSLYNPDAYKIQLNEQCTRISFNSFANYQADHLLTLELPTLRLLEHSLPTCVPWQELFAKSAHSLCAVASLYQKYLGDLRPFYECFLDIDELCHVVQPRLPTTTHNWRLFVLREHVFLKLSIGDPFSPLASMSVQIVGPTEEVSQLRQVYSEGMRNWDADLDIYKNLLRIFDLCFFPMPPPACEEEQQYCNICYCYRLDEAGEVPIVSCDNARCNVTFHAACLREWFNTLSDGKIFLDVSFGACPFCKAKLSTSFVELLSV